MKTWILLANKGKAIIYAGKNETSDEIIKQFINSNAFHKESELFSDRSGSSKTSFTSNQTSVSENHYKEEAQSKFANEIIDFLDKKIQAKTLENLIIISEKGFIGDLRNKFTPALKKTVSREILKNFYTEKVHDMNIFLKEHPAD